MGQSETFAMPDPLPDHLGLSLSDILNPRGPGDDAGALPKALGAARNVERAMAKAKERGMKGGWAFPQGLSDRWGAKAAPRTAMPCLLHSNSQGYWLGSRGRHALVEEHARAQGLEASSVAWPRETTSFALLGNSMARCILQRLIHRLVCTWGIFKGPDSWETAIAQARLRAEASRQPLAPPPRAPLAPQADRAWERLQQALLDSARGGSVAEQVVHSPCCQEGPWEASPPKHAPVSAPTVGGGCGVAGWLGRCATADEAPTEAWQAGSDAEVRRPLGAPPGGGQSAVP